MPLFRSSSATRSSGRGVPPDSAIAGETPPASPNTIPQQSCSQYCASSKNDWRLNRLWKQIEANTDTDLLTEFRVDANSSGYRCIRNKFQIFVKQARGKPAPIHAHQWVSPRMGKNEAAHAFSAAQSPPANGVENQLIHALDSGEGIFQFVSPRSHRTGRSSHEKSIINIVKDWREANPGAGLTINGRYEITHLELLEGNHKGENFARYCITARDLKTNTERQVPLTQVGLKFDGQVLQESEIHRADALLEDHKRQVAVMRNAVAAGAVSNQDNSSLRCGPLIVSHVGIGRNAALITFNDIRRRIDDEGTVNKKNLDKALLDVISAGRAARGPGFLHSKEQLKVVRQMSLELIEAREQGGDDNRAGLLKSTGRAVQRRLSRIGSPRALGQTIAESQPPATAQPPATEQQLFDRQQSPPMPTAGSVAHSAVTPITVQPQTISGNAAAQAALQLLPTRRINEEIIFISLNENDPNSRSIFTFSDARLNIERICQSLQLDTHAVKGISEASHHCWWRAGWLSALLQHAQSSHPSDHLEGIIVEAIGEDYRCDARVITTVIESLRRDGLSSVIDRNKNLGPGQNEISAQCWLRAPGSLVPKGSDEKDEGIFQRLSVALLIRAGIKGPKIDDAVNKGESGDEELLAALCLKLKVDMVICAKVKATNTLSVSVFAHEDSNLDEMAYDQSERQIFTGTFINRIAGLPVIFTGGQHYDLAIPVALLPNSIPHR